MNKAEKKMRQEERPKKERKKIFFYSEKNNIQFCYTSPETLIATKMFDLASIALQKRRKKESK